jgi:hypothetical protein
LDSPPNYRVTFLVAVHGLKLEIGNLVEMKRAYELDVYKLAEELPDMVWQDFDRWNKKVQTRLLTPGTGGQDIVGYQIIRSSKTVQKVTSQ